MRVRLDDLVRDSLFRARAVPAITAYSFSAGAAVVAAAESARRGVALLVPPARFSSASGVELVRGLRTLADAASVPVVVQLDHATDPALIRAAVAAGADAVMADGSAMSIDDNVRFVRAVKSENPRVVVEAELGAVAGDEDRSVGATASGFTAADDVAGFVAASGADLLAPSVGNVHGAYRGEPDLQWELVEAIEWASPVPLTLHGASGISATDLGRAIHHGFGKVNVNTELRAVTLATLEQRLAPARESGDDVLGVERALWDATHAFALQLLADLEAPRPARAA